ncbi:hypothetical protein TPL01_33040 [Sulfuriferula plumbiphila]|uniref:Endonuclease/exonuclease/phosphatase domain-containing protein n=1 Tax=Sulfuriferula plumbiphila TaxID=171865 RepID=A0A512LCF5_9PROT|nr:hypothetical protein [Sulfuriferula plumbiphila]BBP04916.1 hypothetical protein SFPGR_23380 [Sulfuriferula plumbiphila]GEP32166.1 hypothetical protein TPL01_33040 [Sulfuriferula plumbiphila]
MKLTVLTYNTLFGGRDGSDDRGAQAQIGLINELKPDIFLMLEAAGWVDVGHALGGSSIPRVSTTGFTGTEFAVMRCNYLLASNALADHARSYQVIRTP